MIDPQTNWAGNTRYSAARWHWPETAEQVQQAVTFMESQGLKVTGVAANNLLINVTGSVAATQQAFGVPPAGGDPSGRWPWTHR